MSHSGDTQLDTAQSAVEGLLSKQLARLDADGENGLAKLVLSLVDLIHHLLEAQALRRIEEGTLDEDQSERVGCVLMEQARQIDALCQEFGIRAEDLAINLGPLTTIE